MIVGSTTVQDRLVAPARGKVYLVALYFKSSTIRFNTSTENFTIDGDTYLGFGNLVQFPPLQESEDSAPKKLQLKFSLVKQALLAAVIGDASEYRLRKVRIYLQLMTPEFVAEGEKLLRWRGYMDKVSTEKSKSDQGFTGYIKLDCMRPGLSRVRNYEGLKVTYQQRHALYPADRGLEYLQELIQTPQPWLTVEFQKQRD